MGGGLGRLNTAAVSPDDDKYTGFRIDRFVTLLLAIAGEPSYVKSEQGIQARRCLYGEGFFVGKRGCCLDIVVGQPQAGTMFRACALNVELNVER
jgi:hypothetical protein